METSDGMMQPRIRIALAWKLCAFVGALLLGHVLAGVVALFLPAHTRLPLEFWTLALSAVAVLAVSALFLRLFDGRPLRTMGIGFDPRWLRNLFLGTLLGLSSIACVWVMFVAAGWADWRLNTELRSQLWGLVVAFGISVTIAFYEELLCRGYVFQELARWNRIVAVVVTATYFVAIHLPQAGGTSPIVAANMFLASALYALCVFRTGSLWFGIGIHFAWNFALAIVFGMPLSGQALEGVIIETRLPPGSVWTGNEFGPEGGLVVTLVLAVTLLLLWRVLPRSQASSARPDGGSATANAPAKLANLSPAIGPQRVRFHALDVLRGLALLGILPLNMPGFAMHDAAVLNPYACEWTDPLNVAVWTLTSALFGRKDLMLFAMLFGAGIVMIADRCDHAGRSAAQTHVPRMVALMLIGVAHGYLIWSGDILFTYSVCGLVVFVCRRWSPARLFFAGTVLYAVPMVLLVAAQLVVPHLRDAWREVIFSAYAPTQETIHAHYEAFRGSWLDQMPYRISAALSQQTLLLVFVMGWVSAGMMLIGMGLYRLGVLTGGLPRPGYRRLLGWSAGIGFPLTALGLYLNFRNGWRPEFSFFVGRLPIELGAPLLALACIGAVMLVFPNRHDGRLGIALAAVGQMALSNYLVHSLVCTFLFYGHGLGWVGRVDRVQQLFLAMAIWAAQLLYSPVWLRHFQFGPVEWLWRSMSYLRWQPMRNHRVPAGS